LTQVLARQGLISIAFFFIASIRGFSQFGQKQPPDNRRSFSNHCRWLSGRTTICLLGALVLALSAACTPAPRPVEPPIIVPTHFSVSGEEIVPGRWWLAFDDPVLDQLIVRALTDNFGLKTVRDRLHQVEAAARRTSASLSPVLHAEANVSRSSDSSTDAASRRNYSLGAVAGYEIDLWGRLHSQREAAGLDALASREDLETAAISLSAQVALVWYQLVEQYGQQDLLTSQLLINNQVLELVTLRFRRGQAGGADILQQRQLIQANKGRQAEVASLIGILEHRLAILLGSPPSQQVSPRKAELLDLPPLPRTGLPTELIRNRPDLRRAHYRILAADHNLAAAIADRFPRLSLTARVNTGGDQVNDIFSNWLTNIAANLVGPIVDGGFRAAEIERARAVAAEELNSYGQVLLEALGEVENALVREARQQELIDSLDQQLLLAEEVTNLVRDRYFRGAESYLRVLDALARQQGLQRDHLAARRQLIENRIALYRALGGGWEMTPS
jgi:NodT family efflux transporter outer membrane factor (OMF) lipoprotein